MNSIVPATVIAVIALLVVLAIVVIRRERVRAKFNLVVLNLLKLNVSEDVGDEATSPPVPHIRGEPFSLPTQASDKIDNGPCRRPRLDPAS